MATVKQPEGASRPDRAGWGDEGVPDTWGVGARGALTGLRSCALLGDVNDVARFRPDDPDALVVASFACPVCLHRPSFVRLAEFFDEPSATVACLPCGSGWEIALTDLQMLRLTLGPPRGLALERAAGLAL
jgi:hypothetical protein